LFACSFYTGRAAAAAAAVCSQADVTIHELVRVVTKMVLLYLNQLTTTSQWPALWVGVLTALGAAQSCGSEVLSEAVPPALQNLLLMLHDRVSENIYLFF
jgi:hypothetical protein